MLGNARDAEIVADAADAQDERVVRQRSGWQHFVPVLELHRRQMQLATRAIETDDVTLAEAEAMPMRECQIIDAVHVDVHSSRGNFVQQRLPHVRLEMVDERDLGHAFPPELVAEHAGERQSARAAPDDHGLMRHATLLPFAKPPCRAPMGVNLP